MSEMKEFSELNGYGVKDPVARAEIAKLKEGGAKIYEHVFTVYISSTDEEAGGDSHAADSLLIVHSTKKELGYKINDKASVRAFLDDCTVTNSPFITLYATDPAQMHRTPVLVVANEQYGDTDDDGNTLYGYYAALLGGDVEFFNLTNYVFREIAVNEI